MQAALSRRGQDEGTLRSIDTRILAVTYMGTIDAMLAYLDLHSDTDKTAYAATVANILLDGITTRGPQRTKPARTMRRR